MILYLDASALVKRYINEKESDLVNEWIDAAEVVVTGLITRVEVVAAIARAGRMNIISPEEAQVAIHNFRAEWESFHRLPITENNVLRGDMLAYARNLRGYDATHLASALIWQESVGAAVTLACFDEALAGAAREVNLETLPKAE